MWEWLLALLAGLSAPPNAEAVERPRAAAAVAVAYAIVAGEAAPQPPAPAPKPPKPQPGKCPDCGGLGYIIHGDGNRTVCPCQSSKPAPACPDGKCPLPAAPATPVLPSGKIYRR
jgi:hypothetical protein